MYVRAAGTNASSAREWRVVKWELQIKLSFLLLKVAFESLVVATQLVTAQLECLSELLYHYFSCGLVSSEVRLLHQQRLLPEAVRQRTQEIS